MFEVVRYIQPLANSWLLRCYWNAYDHTIGEPLKQTMKPSCPKDKLLWQTVRTLAASRGQHTVSRSACVLHKVSFTGFCSGKAYHGLSEKGNDGLDVESVSCLLRYIEDAMNTNFHKETSTRIFR